MNMLTWLAICMLFFVALMQPVNNYAQRDDIRRLQERIAKLEAGHD